MFKFFSFFGSSQPKKWRRFFLGSSTGGSARTTPDGGAVLVLAGGEATLSFSGNTGREGITAYLNAGSDSIDLSLRMSQDSFSTLKKVGTLDLLVEWDPKKGKYCVSMVLLGKHHSIEIEFEFE